MVLKWIWLYQSIVNDKKSFENLKEEMFMAKTPFFIWCFYVLLPFFVAISWFRYMYLIFVFEPKYRAQFTAIYY